MLCFPESPYFVGVLSFLNFPQRKPCGGCRARVMEEDGEKLARLRILKPGLLSASRVSTADSGTQDCPGCPCLCD